MAIVFQSLFKKWNARVISGAVVDESSLLLQHKETGGTVTLNGATPVTVTDNNVTANSQITFTLKTVGGTVGAYPAIQTITPGTGFTVAGTALDTSVYNYLISY
jgi:hypothetical protein